MSHLSCLAYVFVLSVSVTTRSGGDSVASLLQVGKFWEQKLTFTFCKTVSVLQETMWQLHFVL